MVWVSGLHALIRAGQGGCRGCIENAVHYAATASRQGQRPTQLCKRLKSSAAFLNTSQQPDGDSIGQKISSTSKQGPQYSKDIMILLVEKSSEVECMKSYEAPVIHHAREGAVVDVRRNQQSHDTYSHTHTSHATYTHPSHTHTPHIQHSVVEIRLPVDQLLKDTHLSVQRAEFLEPYEENLEYIEERKDQKREKTRLIGALPPGALDWRPQQIEIHKLGSYYASLSKSRLTGLVVMTAMAGYAMAPGPLDPATFILCSLGTGLVSSAANSINQFLEVPFDSQMDRTKNRILVQGLVSPLHAISFAIVCSTTGISMLYFGANGVAASLGALNLVLYTSVYTPMKRLSITNTWIGAVVGAIPPLIGWTSCTGELEAGAWVMAGILFAWQFPHFNSLSWNLRPDYSRAGYRMMSVTNPGLCRRVALRYSIVMIGLCTLAPVIDVTTWTFAADSLPLNLYLTYLAWKFYKDADSKSSRKLFFFTLIHLPAIMILIIISKKHYSKKKNSEIAKISSSGGNYVKSDDG